MFGEKTQATVTRVVRFVPHWPHIGLSITTVVMPDGHKLPLDQNNQITYANVLGRRGYRSATNDLLINLKLRQRPWNTGGKN
jgi:hypothetical protein